MHRVADHDAPVRALQDSCQHRLQCAIDLDRDQPRTPLEDSQRERADPRPDLQDQIAAGQPGQRDDLPDRVRIGDEVLADRGLRPQPVPLQERARLSGTEHHAQPNNRAAFAEVARATSSAGTSFTVAIASATSETYAGSLDLPRCGTGVRNGASVSTTIRSRGARAAASRRSLAFLNVTTPANDRIAPASNARVASCAPPE